MAVRPHLGLFTLPVIAAVAIRMKYGENDAFVKHHATEALNAQIWFGILWNAVGLSMLASLVAAGEHHEDLFLAGWLTMAGSFVLAGAMAMRGAVMAYRQTWWRYPLLPYRFVREASSEPTGHKPADRSNSFGSSK